MLKRDGEISVKNMGVSLEPLKRAIMRAYFPKELQGLGLGDDKFLEEAFPMGLSVKSFECLIAKSAIKEN